MARHIQEFCIHDYKGIHDLKLEALNDINILTGDNNCGKTSVLEILSTLEHPEYTRSWALCSRIENARVRNRLYFHGFYNMFPLDNDMKKIAYDYRDINHQVHSVVMEMEIENKQIAEKEMFRLNGLLRTDTTKIEDEILDVACMHLCTYLNDKWENEDYIYDFQTKISNPENEGMPFVRTVYVSPVDHANGTLYLDSILADPELYEELIHILREFDDSIISINVLKNEKSPFVSEYMILSKKHKKALPLNSYGDGMKKALLLLSAIVQGRDGILLLDEFETAIHTSAMDSIFSWLLKSALRLNIQVFLTSHCKEAIGKLLNVEEGLQNHINLYTLYDFEGKNYVRMMGCKQAIDAQENLGLELR